MSEKTSGFMELLNWPGLFSGLVMVALPFLGPWWRFEIGEAINLSLSPFHYEFVALDVVLSFPFLEYLLIAFQVLFVLGGIIMVAGSLGKGKWWEEQTVKFGYRKGFWVPVVFVLLLLLGAFLFNNFLSDSVVEGAMGPGSVSVEQFDVPYLVGSSSCEASIDSMTVSAPVEMSVTPTFFVVLVLSILSFIAVKYGTSDERSSQRKLR
ncbi:MAG: hypothetical protein ACLFTY_01610 [Candidatus Aenigmatarchaeota archaeon]